MEQGGAEAEAAPQDKMEALDRETQEVVDIMTENIQKVLQREENLSELLDTSDEMKKAAQGMKQMTPKLARSYWWKNVKLIVVIVIVVLIIVFIIILLATGVIPVSAPVPP